MEYKASFKVLAHGGAIIVLLSICCFLICYITKSLYSTIRYKKETPFCVVLVDIEKAAKGGEIHCVAKPLPLPSDNDAYIAVSYRWGKLAETTLDTHMGYLASITSFDVADFCTLCQRIRQDSALKEVAYVWVDAICIDQSHPERRKATIYRMTDIYNSAKHIVAVPDLHLRYLSESHANTKTILAWTRLQRQYLYHLLHQHTEQLVALDDQWLDTIGVPREPSLRKRLAHQGLKSDHSNDTISSVLPSELPWQYQIRQRHDKMQQSMAFLEDLIKDWSSRVWVINEYTIAKRKNRIKYWFIQLDAPLPPPPLSSPSFSFFDFDFGHRLAMQAPTDKNSIFKSRMSSHALTTQADVMYQQFRQTMFHQLDQQSFLEMILKSKASKNDDRFHAILPLSDYHAKLGSKDVVDSWNITGLVSVKLKLYEWMSTRDKLNLLFLSATSSTAHQRPMVLPTFATTHIEWPATTLWRSSWEACGPCNFDLTRSSTIQLLPFGRRRYKLHIKPCSYYWCVNPSFKSTVRKNYQNLCRQIQLKETAPVNMIRIPSYGDDGTVMMGDHPQDTRQVVLVGSLAEDKWMLLASFASFSMDTSFQWTLKYIENDNVGFTIY